MPHRKSRHRILAVPALAGAVVACASFGVASAAAQAPAADEYVLDLPGGGSPSPEPVPGLDEAPSTQDSLAGGDQSGSPLGVIAGTAGDAATLAMLGGVLTIGGFGIWWRRSARS